MSRLQAFRWYLLGAMILSMLGLFIWLIIVWRGRGQERLALPTPTMERLVTIPVIPTGPLVIPTVDPRLIPTDPPTPVMRPGKQIISGIAVNDFSGIRPFDPQGDRALVETDTYHIVYLKQFEQFKIAVKGTDFNTSRQAAERDFLRIVGVDEANACRLSVLVYVPNYVKNSHAGLEYPLSLCEHEEDGL